MKNNSTPAKPPHNTKLGLGGIGLTLTRNNKHGMAALHAVGNELEPILINSGYLDGAPFSWVTVDIRYGLEDEMIPHYFRIDKKYGDLPLAIEVDTQRLVGVSLEELTKIFRLAVLRALVHAADKYQRPADIFREMLTEAEKEANKQLGSS